MSANSTGTKRVQMQKFVKSQMLLMNGQPTRFSPDGRSRATVVGTRRVVVASVVIAVVGRVCVRVDVEAVHGDAGEAADAPRDVDRAARRLPQLDGAAQLLPVLTGRGVSVGLEHHPGCDRGCGGCEEKSGV